MNPEIEIRRFVTEIRCLADEIENLARPWTRSGDEFVRKMADQISYRVELLRRLGDDMQDIARRM